MTVILVDLDDATVAICLCWLYRSYGIDLMVEAAMHMGKSAMTGTNAMKLRYDSFSNVTSISELVLSYHGDGGGGLY